MSWIKVYYAQDEIDARMVEGLLKSNDIEVQVIAKSSNNIIKNPLFHTHAGNPYEIFVPENKKEEAEKILNSTK